MSSDPLPASPGLPMVRASGPPRAPVAQLDRALPSEGRGRTFESCRVRHPICCWRKGMFGSGKRKRELEQAAKNATTKLLEGAILEDRRRRGDNSEEPPSTDELRSTVAAWCATAQLTWQKAKRGDTDALRQTARNYLLGTGMPVKPQKARLWLAVSRLLEIGPGMEEPTLDPFWIAMEDELKEMLTGKEQFKALNDASDWVKVHRQLHRNSRS